MEKYDHTKIEKKWQKKWEDTQAFRATENSSKKKSYLLIEFPYPSGDGLHVGHVRSFTAMDIVARKRRAQGEEVLYPIGWDAFGLPTENYAIKTGKDPRVVTKDNTDNFRRQMKSLGLSFDWSREINTTDPTYYKWTQWIFLQLYKKGLAYKAKTLINWCPKDKIGLANEEVVDGACERCGTQVEKREKEQWMLAITKYAQRLYDGLEHLDYIERAKTQQRNWIGPSTGINIKYHIDGHDATVTVFTTRPDTNFGATFLVAAPDGVFVKENLSMFPNAAEVQTYIQETVRKTDIERLAEGKKKTGVFTGLYALNQLNNKKLPIYVGDFVLGHVGTGVVVGVPGHDMRDFEFAKAMGIEIVRVVVGPDGDTSAITKAEQIQEESGTMTNSQFLDGMDIHAATIKIMDYLEEKRWGERVANYKLRDWVFSRQRYWGEPIPMISCTKCGWVPVPESQLPVTLPIVERYQPTDNGESPLAAIADWVNTTCPTCGGAAKRETDVMPNWAGSSWYFLRYADPQDDKEFASMDTLKYWLGSNGVDWYNGGMEHTTLHLLYSRFWHQFLFDQGLVPTPEPYAKRTSHGLILAQDGSKMSKSKGNVVNPDTVIANYGADSLRLYEMFLGPFDQPVAWNTDSMAGVYRFLERVWKYVETWKDNYDKDAQHGDTSYDKEFLDEKIEFELQKLIAKITTDIEALKGNTAVAALMTFMNILREERPGFFTKTTPITKRQLQIFMRLLNPFAPHITSELWERAGFDGDISTYSWPIADSSKLVASTASIAVQINGKVRATLELSTSANEVEALSAARADSTVAKWLAEGREVKAVYVPGRIINFVVSQK